MFTFLKVRPKVVLVVSPNSGHDPGLDPFPDDDEEDEIEGSGIEILVVEYLAGIAILTGYFRLITFSLVGISSLSDFSIISYSISILLYLNLLY
jgi:hypothetical protein